MRTLLLISTALLSTLAVAQQPAQRVVSLAPHATEIAFAAGLGDKVVAVSEYSDYPEETKNIEKVANYQGIKLERIIALRPDLIIAWPGGNPARELEKLKSLGFNLYYSQAKSLDGIADNIEALSQYAEDPQIGMQAAQKYREQLNQLKAQYSQQQTVSFFYQLSEKPIITLAQDNWPNEVFEFCGGENIFKQSSVPYPQVSIEQVATKKPDVIFTSEHAIQNGNMWLKWETQLPAVENKHVWSLTSDWLNRPTPRTLLAVKEVCQHFDAVRKKL